MHYAITSILRVGSLYLLLARKECNRCKLPKNAKKKSMNQFPEDYDNIINNKHQAPNSHLQVQSSTAESSNNGINNNSAYLHQPLYKQHTEQLPQLYSNKSISAYNYISNPLFPSYLSSFSGYSQPPMSSSLSMSNYSYGHPIYSGNPQLSNYSMRRANKISMQTDSKNIQESTSLAPYQTAQIKFYKPKSMK